MEALDLLIYLVAALGVLVLLLCIVLAAILIYQHCRKLKLGGYTPVSHLENGPTVLGYNRLQSPDGRIGGGRGVAEVKIVNELNTTDEPSGKCSPKNNDESHDISEILLSADLRDSNDCAHKKSDEFEFSEDDFPFPVQKTSRARKVIFNPRISRSDWDIHEFRPGGNREEIELPLLRNSRDNSIKSKLSNEATSTNNLIEIEDDQFKSQYFDAKESISDEEEEVMDEDFEDIDDDEDHSRYITTPDRRRYHPLIHLKSQSLVVQSRVKALKKLLLKRKQLESALHRDIHKLEGRFYSQQQLSVFNNRRRTVEGQQIQPTILEEDEEGEEDTARPFVGQGVEGFWLRVFLNSKNLRQIVQATDIPALTQLVDVRVSNFAEPLLGFRLTFVFTPCDQFTDTELTKDYFLKTEPGEDDDPLYFEGPEVVGCQGCKIHWKRHQNLTIRPIKRVQNHKIVTKWARKNSFFNFFNPPKVGSADDVHHLKQRELLEAHYELGLFFKEQVVPKAYLFFTRTGYDGAPPNIHNRLRLKSLSKTNTGSGHRTPRRRVSVSNDKLLEVKKTDKVQTDNEGDVVGVEEVCQTDIVRNEYINDNTESFGKEDINDNTDSVGKEDINDNTDSVGKEDMNDNILEDVLEHPIVSIEHPTEILESIGVIAEKDIFPGRYLMESSDKFDEWMKAMGVGMIKRKLANSVIPINENEITDTGLYILRTLTTVRNTEISFHLGEPFDEDTLDGRRTKSLATRIGDQLVITQVGDKSKGEKDTTMTREVKGDLMTVKLIVDSVECTRTYRRM